MKGNKDFLVLGLKAHKHKDTKSLDEIGSLFKR